LHASRIPSNLLVAIRYCVLQRWSARRESHPHTLAGTNSSGWRVCCSATSRRGALGWFCPSDLRRVGPALYLAELRGHRPPRQDSHLRPPASKAGALSAELLGAGGACRTRTGVWLCERELSLAARRTPQGKLKAESAATTGTLSSACFHLFLRHRAAVLPCAPGGTSSVCRCQHLRGPWSRELDLPQRPPRYERGALTA
jgi:hypothetical protein